MNMKKLFVILVLSVFVTGMCIGVASATKNSDGSADVTIKGETYHLNANDMKKVDKDEVKVEKNGKLTKQKTYKVKTVTKKVKKPVYKYKTVKVSKWVVKKVCNSETWYYSFGSFPSKSKAKSYSTKKYWNSKNWKYCGYSYEVCSDSYSIGDEFYDHTKYYTHFKQKVNSYKKVKYVHHYKTVKVKEKQLVFTGYKTEQTHLTICKIQGGPNYKGVEYVYSVKLYTKDYRTCLAFVYYDESLTKTADPYTAWGN